MNAGTDSQSGLDASELAPIEEVNTLGTEIAEDRPPFGDGAIHDLSGGKRSGLLGISKYASFINGGAAI